jgi:hypothetical protein
MTEDHRESRPRNARSSDAPRPAGVRTPADPARPPYRAALVAALATLGLYVLTLAPTTQFWDTSEYIATAHIMGIPHPPGNPLFVLLARAWELLLAPTGLSVAVRINLFSAVMSAAAHGFWFLLVHRILSSFSDSRTFRIAGAAAAVAISATAFTVWNQSNVNEKVYTVSLFTIALLSWLVFRWRDQVRSGKGEKLLLLSVYVLALSVGNHLMAFLAAPALLLFVALVRPKSFLSWKLHATGVAAVLLGLSVHLFLPIRAERGPVINQNDPRCESLGSALTSIVTMGGRGCAELSASLQREQYRKTSVKNDPVAGYYGEEGPRTADMVVAQVANFVQYFDWQWARSIAGTRSWFGGARPLFTVLFLALGLFGALAHWRRDRIGWAYVLALFGTLSLGLVVYMNFRYGYTYPFAPEPAAVGFPEVREVRERDYFFTVTFSVWGLWTGIGLAALWQRATEHFAGVWRRPALLTAPILAVALIPLALNWSWATRAGDHTARDWAYNVLMSVEPYGVLFTNGDNDTFPLWYLQEVEGIRRDVTVIVGSYFSVDWYAKQIRDLTRPCASVAVEDASVITCQRPYVAMAAPYSVPEQPPGDSVLPLTDQEIDVVASQLYVVPQPTTFRAAEIEANIPAGTVLEPSDTFTTAIVQAWLGRRPLHFVAPSPVIAKLNLGPYTVRTGLTLRLSATPVPLDRSVVALPEESASVTGRWIDLETTETLLDDVFAYRGMPDTDRPWADSATTNILMNYVFAHVATARAHALAGNAAEAGRHAARADAWAAHVR